MPIDPKTQPLAALVKKWRDRAGEIQKRLDRHNATLWPHKDCLPSDMIARLLAERTECIEHAKQLEAALMAQQNVWHDRLLTRGGGEYSCGEIDALGACISDLKVGK